MNARTARQPIVVVVGHVDHGKTTLLDAIRKTNVAAREAGGITQAVGAYEIEHGGKPLTFIDTPGHEAFISMRSRGASIADLAILVVAGDDGVKPQTKESIRILTETKTPFVVAITKTDKPGSDIERVKQDLAANGVLLEGYGGSISFQAVSGKTGDGLSDLLDLLLLTAELEELTYDPHTPARGVVLESRRTKTRGAEPMVIITDGTLKKGDEIATKTASGKVRILENYHGAQTESLIAGKPAIIVGWDTLPKAGEEFIVGGTVEIITPSQKKLEKDDGDTKILRLVLKAGDTGSLEALSQILHAMSDKQPIRIIDESVGEIMENDIKLAASTGSRIISFKTKTDASAKTLAQAQEIEIISSEIIYELITAVEDLFARIANPPPTGDLEVLAIFNQSKLDKQLVGGRVVRGIIKNKMSCEIIRADGSKAPGRIINLQESKRDTPSVAEGRECGIIIQTGAAIAVGDHITIKA